MKYSKSILVLMIINIFTALILIFIGHQTRNLEIINISLIENINKNAIIKLTDIRTTICFVYFIIVFFSLPEV